MNGGPSQIDTFDLKPGHANGGPFKADRDGRARASRSASTCPSSPSR